MKLTVQYIDSVAELSRLKLTDTEKNEYAEELEKVFRYIDKMQEVNTDNVKPTAFVDILQVIQNEK